MQVCAGGIIANGSSIKKKLLGRVLPVAVRRNIPRNLRSGLSQYVSAQMLRVTLVRFSFFSRAVECASGSRVPFS